MADEQVVPVELTRNEVKLIQCLIVECYKVFGQDGVPTLYGETRVGVKMLKAIMEFDKSAADTWATGLRKDGAR